MVASSTLAFVSPVSDSTDARRAADEIANLIRRIGANSITGMVLRQTQQELQSLIRSIESDGKSGTVVGPLRISVAA